MDDNLLYKNRKTILITSDDSDEQEKDHIDQVFQESSEQSSQSDDGVFDELLGLISLIKKKDDKKESLEKLLELVKSENVKKYIVDFVSFYLLEILLTKVEYRFLIIDIFLKIFNDGTNCGKGEERLLQALTGRRILFLLTDSLYITRDSRIISFVTTLIQMDSNLYESRKKEMIRILTGLYFFHMCAALPSRESCGIFETIFGDNIFKIEKIKSKITQYMLKIVGDAYIDAENDMSRHSFHLKDDQTHSDTTNLLDDQNILLEQTQSKNKTRKTSNNGNHISSFASYSFSSNSLNKSTEESENSYFYLRNTSENAKKLLNPQNFNDVNRKEELKILINNSNQQENGYITKISNSESTIQDEYQTKFFDFAPSVFLKTGCSEQQHESSSYKHTIECKKDVAFSKSIEFTFSDVPSRDPRDEKDVAHLGSVMFHDTSNSDYNQTGTGPALSVSSTHQKSKLYSESLDLAPSGYDWTNLKENKSNKFDVYEDRLHLNTTSNGNISKDDQESPNDQSLYVLSYLNKNKESVQSPPTTLVTDIDPNCKNQMNKSENKKSKLYKKFSRAKFSVPYAHETKRPLFPPRLTIREKIDLFPYRSMKTNSNKKNTDDPKEAALSQNLIDKKEISGYNNDYDCLTVLTCVFLSNYTNFLSYKPIFSLNTILKLNNFLGSNILDREISALLRNMGNNIVQWLKDYTEKIDLLEEKLKRRPKHISNLIPAPQVLQRLSRVTLANSGFQTFLKEKYMTNGHAIFLHQPDLIHPKFWIDKIILYLGRECVHFTSVCGIARDPNYNKSYLQSKDSTQGQNSTCNCFINCEKWASLVVLTHHTVPYRLSTIIVIHKLYKYLRNNHKFAQISLIHQQETKILQGKVIEWLYTWLSNAIAYLKKSHMNWARMIFGFDSLNYAELPQNQEDNQYLFNYHKEDEKMGLLDTLKPFESDETQLKKRYKQIIDSESDDQEIVASDDFQ